MKCAKAKKFISEYIDGDLDKAKASSLEKHLDACPDCQKLLKDFKQIKQKAKEFGKSRTFRPNMVPDPGAFKTESAVSFARTSSPVFVFPGAAALCSERGAAANGGGRGCGYRRADGESRTIHKREKGPGICNDKNSGSGAVL